MPGASHVGGFGTYHDRTPPLSLTILSPDEARADGSEAVLLAAAQPEAVGAPEASRSAASDVPEVY